MAKKSITETLGAEQPAASGKVTKQPAAPVTDNFDKIRELTKDLNSHYKSKILKTGKDISPIRKIPFEEPALDYVYDGGIPIGRFVEGLGQEHSGKTRNALRGMARFQHYCFNCWTAGVLDAVWELDKNKMPVLKSCKCKNCTDPKTKIQVIVDYEGTTDIAFIRKFNIDPNGIIYTRPSMPSTAVDIVDAYLREPGIGMILFDSVGGMGSDKEVENAIKDDKMNQNALFLNKACRKWQSSLNSNSNTNGSESGTTLYIVNQSYSTIGMYTTEVAQGGRGLRHGKGISVKSRIKELVYAGKERESPVIGVHIILENKKNKTGMPYRKSEYFLNLNKEDTLGYCMTNIPLQYMEFALLFGIVEQASAWLNYGASKWQGKANLLLELQSGSAVAQAIIAAVNDKLYEAN